MKFGTTSRYSLLISVREIWLRMHPPPGVPLSTVNTEFSEPRTSKMSATFICKTFKVGEPSE